MHVHMNYNPQMMAQMHGASEVRALETKRAAEVRRKLASPLLGASEDDDASADRVTAAQERNQEGRRNRRSGDEADFQHFFSALA